MNLIEALLGGQADGAVEQLGRQFGLDPSQTSSALGALLPAVATGFQRNAASPSGLEALLGALGGGRHGRYVDDVGSLGMPGTVDDGNGILGHIFGSKDVSREVARRASAQSGVGADVLKQMLPVVAAMVMGALAKQQGGGAVRQTGFGQAAAGQGGGGGILDMLTPMLDSNRDGSAVDDIVGMLGKFMGGR